MIDYLRNNRTNTAICAFSPRAREGAPVSTPVEWTELTTPPEHWTLLTVPRRLARLKKDPWAGYWRASQRVTSVAVAALERL